MQNPCFIGPMAAGSGLRGQAFVNVVTQRVCVRPSSQHVAPTMGLNAKSLSKGKGKGKGKGGKGKNAGSAKSGGKAGAGPKTMSADQVAAQKGVDTNKREYIFQMQGVSKTLDNGKQILQKINLAFFPGAKIGVVGGNGAGKSTLLKIMAGVDPDFDGIAVPQAGARIGYLAQEPELPGETVDDVINEAVKETKELLDRYNELSGLIGDESLASEERDKLSNEWSRVQDAIEAKDGWELERNVERALDALRCAPGDAKHAVLSGGERRRVALCGLLLRRPDLLVLDEPTNHLDAESILWLERFFETYNGTVVAVTHDVYFLQNLTQWILDVENGKGIPYEGNYGTYLEAKSRKLAEVEKTESSLRRQIDAELDWIRASPKGRQAKAKARVDKYEQLVEEQKRFVSERSGNLDRIYIPPGPPLGDIVVEAEGLQKSFGDRQLYQNLSFSVPRGAIVGIVGPNGSGKSTCLRFITGEDKPDSGDFKVGETVKLMYASQDRSTVDRDKTVFEAIADGNDEMVLGGRSVKSRAYLSWFNFRGASQQKKVGTLSGGELNRLNLAKCTCEGGNLLLIDEPTNDADTEYIQALETALLNFAGSAIVVAHDRAFLDHVCTHILAFDEEGNSTFFQGNFAAYEEDKRKRLGDTTPSRMKFAKIPALN